MRSETPHHVSNNTSHKLVFSNWRALVPPVSLLVFGATLTVCSIVAHAHHHLDVFFKLQT